VVEVVGVEVGVVGVEVGVVGVVISVLLMAIDVVLCLFVGLVLTSSLCPLVVPLPLLLYPREVRLQGR
jgi:hypothetical protein